MKLYLSLVIQFKYAILVYVLMNSSIVLGQERYTITGSISADGSETVESVTIQVVNLLDTSFTISSEAFKGKFQFDLLEKGKYVVYIEDMRFEKFSQHVDLYKDIELEILLSGKLINLQEVTIQGGNKGLFNDGGNIKLNVHGSLYSSVSNSLDLLQKMPGVIISGDRESLSLFGKGEPLIYIDNQRVSLNDVKSLSVHDIKSIEILDNPSAKYESGGRAVIQILRKISNQDGYEIRLQEIASFKRFFNNYSSFNANYKKGRLELKGNVGFNLLKPRESNGFNLSMADRDINSEYLAVAISKKPELLFGGGVYYQIDENDYWMINATARTLMERYPISTNSYYGEENNMNHIFTLNKNRQDGLSLTTSGNYLKSLRKINASLFFGAQYSSYKQNIDSEISNLYTPDADQNSSQSRQQSYQIDVFTSRIDFEKSTTSGFKIETGANVSLGQSRVALNYQNINPLYEFNSNYNYTENNFAGYSQLARDVGRGSYTLGLRAEHTKVNGGLKSEISPIIDKAYTHLFPKAHIKFEIDSSKLISFSYARNIIRPTYSDASSIKTFITPFLEFARNINLNPTLTNDLSANFQVGGMSVKLNYYWLQNPVYYSFSIDEKENMLTMFPDNLDKEVGTTLSFILPYKYKFLSSINTLTGNIIKVEENFATIGKARPSLYYSSSNTFTLPKDFSAMLYLWGRTKRFEGLYEREPLFVVDLSLSKKIFNRFEITLAANDLFKNMNFTERFNINNITATGNYYLDVHEYSIAIKYNLGAFGKSIFKERRVDDNSNRIR